MKALKIGLFAFGMLAVMHVQGQETREEAPRLRPTAETPPKNGKMMKKFNKLDANGDGVLVLAELQKSKGKEAKDQVNRFNRMDKNNDARVTFAEFKALKKAKKMKKAKKQKKERAQNARGNKGKGNK